MCFYPSCWAKYYYVILLLACIGMSMPAQAQDLIVMANGEVLQGVLKQELSGALKFKAEGQKKSMNLHASEVENYYSSAANINLISRQANNSKQQVFFPDLRDIDSAIEYEFQDGIVQVVPCGAIKLYRFTVLGEENIHGGRTENIEIYLEDTKNGLFKVYGIDVSLEKQQEVLAMFAKANQLGQSKLMHTSRINPKKLDELVLFCNSATR